MGRPVKLSIIGAGSAQFSLGLVKDVCLTPNLAESTICFMDIDAARLEMIHALAMRYAGELGVKLTFEQTTDREAALRDASFVINTAMPGGHDYLEQVRAIAKKHGYYAGAGGMAEFYYYGLMLEVARDMERLCPDAWLIQSSNPVYEGTNLMTRQTGVKVIGLCHGHYGYRFLAQAIGVPPEEVRWVAPGLNHLIWLQEFRHNGEDLYPRLDEWIATKAEDYWREREANPGKYGREDHISRAVVDQYRRFGLFPVGDTTRGGGWWYKTDLPTRQRWYGPLGGFGSDLETPPRLEGKERQIARIRRAATDRSVRVTEEFPPVKTREQQIPIVDALTNDVAAQFQINVPNQGALPGVPDDVVTEIPAIIDAGGIHRIQVQPLPAKIMLEVIRPHILAMDWSHQAYLTGDRGLLLDGLLMLSTYHGAARTVSYEQAAGFLEEVLALPQNRAMAAHYR